MKPPRPTMALMLALMLYVVLAVVYAVVIPPYDDVIENMLPAYNLAQYGFLGMGDVEPTMTYMEGEERYMYWLPPLGYLSMAGWVKLFGCTLLQVRLQVIAWGVVLLAGVYYLGQDWTFNQFKYRSLGMSRMLMRGALQWTGVWAVLICALNYTFLNIPDGRVDMMCAALGVWAIVLGSEWLAAASFLVHPFGGLYALILAIKHRRIRWVPYAIALGLWGLYIAQAPAVWWQQFGGNFIWHFESGGPIIFTPGVFVGFGTGWRNLLLIAYLTCAYLTARRNPQIALWFVPVAVGAFLLARNVNYFPHILPVLALCVAIQMRRHLWLALILALELAFAVTSLFPLWTWDGIFTLR